MLWFDYKTKKGRCKNLNLPWTGPWQVMKKLGDVVYRIKYVGNEKLSVKLRVVHHNQLKRFYEIRDQEMVNHKLGTVFNKPRSESNEHEADNDTIVVTDNIEEQPYLQDSERKSQQDCRPPDWTETQFSLMGEQCND